MSGPIVCVGHAALDRVYRVDALPKAPGKIRALEHVESGGGMAANAATTIAKLGGKVELWSRVGDDDAGHRVKSSLKTVGVDVRYVETFEEGRTSNAVVIVGADGERLVVGARDINMPNGTSWLPLERLEKANLVLADLRWVEAVRVVFARARELGLPTVLDADLGGRESLTEILTLTDYAIFSHGALDEFLPDMDRRQQLDRIMLMGPRHAGVTLGPDGYMWRDTFGGGSSNGVTVPIADTTGAGDAFHGAFALMLSEQRSIAECSDVANTVAAMKCRRLGARSGLPTRDELESFLGRTL
ncbi:MAG: PfkB family carbohydrate kinase [Hyphomicrobiaceae bacterium]